MVVDPTLPRSFEACCPKCTYHEAVYFTNPNKGEESMALTFMCCRPHCGKMWDQVSDEKK
jgi:DNA-directed RNA polymerase subunit M/transcription elongation factor TFIIS